MDGWAQEGSGLTGLDHLRDMGLWEQMEARVETSGRHAAQVLTASWVLPPVGKVLLLT